MSDYTDEQLLMMPASLLDRNDRTRRRRLRRADKERRRSQTRAKEAARGKKIGTCQGIKKNGEYCRANALKGAKHCRAHLNDAERAKLGLKTLHEIGSEAIRLAPSKKSLSVPQAMKSAVEVSVDIFLKRYFVSLGMEFVGFDPEGNPIVIDHGIEKGIRIHGESKDGDISMSEYPDIMAQIQVMEKLMDRTYGKAKQTNILEGNPNAPIAVQPVRSAERSQEVARLLGNVGAVQLGVAPPSVPADVVEGKETEPEPSNVTPIRPE